ncbi:MAG: N-acetylglucosamine repressor [Candidatus Celerinatantimonas neptuna]|nr:MAG: N-acetylglucosamine repressor [Candidatus Celerinatantimonas neptuna]
MISPWQIKRMNIAVVYRLIDQCGPISRIDIAKISQLAPASITKITRQLLDADLIHETAQQQSTGGRRAISLMSNDHFQFLSIRLGRGCLDLAIYDLAGHQYDYQSQPFIAIHEDDVVKELIRAIEEMLRHRGTDLPLIAIAITLSGLVATETGIIRYTPHFGLRDCPLGSLIHQRFHLPTYIGNNTRAMALAEHYLGNAQDIEDSVLVSVHHGTSAGIIVANEVFTYPDRDLGEIGHIQLDPLGETCQCGNIGCLETICSNPSILKRARQLLGNSEYHSDLCMDDEIERVYQLATKGDALCQPLVERAIDALGQAIAIIVNLFNPQKILIAGEIVSLGDRLFERLYKSLRHQTLTSFRKQLKIDKAYFQNTPTIGGAALIKRAMLNGELLIKITNTKSSQTD